VPRQLISHGRLLLDYATAKRAAWTAVRNLVAIAKMDQEEERDEHRRDEDPRHGRHPCVPGASVKTRNGGRTWSTPRRLSRGILGPIKNKPVVLADGALLCPSSTEHLGWRAHLERSEDLGANWRRFAPLNTREFSAIQPCILMYPDGRLQVLCRTRQGVIAACWSSDGGLSWGPMHATSLPNPDSGIDAVSLRDGRGVLAYNPSQEARTPLCLAVTSDGHIWRDALVLEDAGGEYSYPAIIQASDGSLHVTYTWNRRRIRHVRVSPDAW
jgi:predicted neuraminidase